MKNDGDLGEIFECYSIRFRRHSRHSTERLWRAITEPGEIRKWMGFESRIELRPGGDYRIDFAEQGELDGVIVEVQPGHLLKYVWGWSVVVWTLADDGQGCTYELVQNGLADRGEDEEGLAAGWHEFLLRIDRHLDGAYFSDAEQKQNWQSFKPAYRQMLDRVFTARQNA